VDAGIGRGGEDLVAALAQNGDGLRADQAGAADDDDLHDLASLVDDWRTPKRVRIQVKTSREDDDCGNSCGNGRGADQRDETEGPGDQNRESSVQGWALQTTLRPMR